MKNKNILSNCKKNTFAWQMHIDLFRNEGLIDIVDENSDEDIFINIYDVITIEEYSYGKDFVNKNFTFNENIITLKKIYNTIAELD